MKKTSEQWQKLCNLIVYDPDGWDRINYEYSWKQEKITRKEFEKRLMNSTCLGCVGSTSLSIWKDKVKQTKKKSV